MKYYISFILICLFSFGRTQNTIEWQEMDAKLFTEAKAQNKLILLNLEANWCHWCHVMHDSTYSNPDVIAYINEHFIAVSADQDAYPELSIRYKEYGWPATIFLNEQGEDIVKRAGYIAPKWFLKLMKAIVDDPSPELELSNLNTLITQSIDASKKLNQIDKIYDKSIDYKNGGFDQQQKYVAWDSYEYARFFKQTDSTKQWLKASVEGAYNLVDPEWGGVYQYSTHGDWEHLHFEKLMAIQARYIKIFMYHYLYTQDGEALSKVKSTLDYIDDFLNLDGVYYANAQDADLVQGEHAEDFFALSSSDRFKMGVPAIDSNIFTERNAQIASSMLKYYYLSANIYYQQRAYSIFNQLSNRKSSNGLFYHADKKRELFSLKDQIAMAELLIDCIKNEAEHENEYTLALNELLQSIEENYLLKNGSAVSFVGNNGIPAQPLIEENTQLGRIFNWYALFSKENKYKDLAQNILNFLLQDESMDNYYNEPGILMLAHEIENSGFDYVEMKDQNSELLREVKAYAPFNACFYSYKKSELPDNKKELFEGFKSTVILACTDNYCSAPIFDISDIKQYFLK